MRVGAILSPVADWPAVAEAAVVADRSGLDAVGLWDHYHSQEPHLAYLCGWSLYGAIAATTTRLRLVPMVLNALHYDLGVLAKESSILSIASGGRFELGIGAGDWPESFAAWGQDYPSAEARLNRLDETVAALRRIWTGEPVVFTGTYVRLDGAICTPAPAEPPRVVAGVARSRRTLERAIAFADEVNVYADESFVDEALRRTREAGRNVDVSLFLDWSWDEWPADPAATLRTWADRGIERCFVSIGGPEMGERVATLADAMR
jgi:alkanesulfonate monooxygenase SsuD/methylene tetrahydromethanopterin reductase-like flavin-dependent oxidoreductase (luciferase family)